MKALWRSVSCSSCGAFANAPCTNKAGVPVRPHAARLLAAGLPVSRRKGTPIGKPRDYAWFVSCTACGAAAQTPCLGRTHGYHGARVTAGEAYRVQHGLPPKKRRT